ncbi:protein-tyrosine phosphatase-like protein, partial [Suillus subaureus]
MSNNDFFTSVPFSGQQRRTHSTDQENVVSFAHAIAARFGSADLLTARILPDEQPPSQNIILPPKPVLPTPSKPVSSSSLSSTFIPVNPPDLPAYLADPSILILDIRPHAAHTAARIHRALSLSIPSTLIKRPLFGLSKIVQMLPSSSARARFAAWPTVNHILVYDVDSVLVPDTSNIAGLLRKFRAEGFTGELAWVKGGFQAVWRDARHCATTDHPSPDEDDLEGTASSGALRPKHLPKSAFSLSTTTAANAASGTPAVANAANPFFDTIRQNLELSQGITERIPLRLPRRVRRRIKDLPFRWLQDIANSNDPDVEEGAETLAMQFYRIELAEQRRLRSVMEHHARESETLPSTPMQGAFPFSITAGVEKGAKNRYNHIWPFEHARVRIHDGHRPRDPSPADDYVNASYVQPLGTRKRYIATQGPLPATFVDFWTLVWEQNVHVIVMLTREIENAMVKCGTYWVESSYGPLQLQLLNTSPPISPSTSSNTSANIGFFMSPHERDKGSKQPSMIVRTFALSHRGYPGIPPRKVTHLQYLDWPDMNVPDDPRGVLELVKCVERATGIAAFALGCSPPVLLHCSAGVGRTGGFIAVDALPRQLHQDVSPAPLMSHNNPISTIVQDMREQRMSLCQSLRQYVFVHAAVIEGALMMVDE